MCSQRSPVKSEGVAANAGGYVYVLGSVRGGDLFQTSVPSNWQAVSSNTSVKFVPQNAYGYLNRLKANTRDQAADGTPRPAAAWVGLGGRARQRCPHR